MSYITLQYLGIPLLAGIVTRFTVWLLFSKNFLLATFLPYFSPLSLLGLLYTIIVMFAYQGHHILHTLGPVFRTIVPLLLYFLIMWTLSFWMLHWLTVRSGRVNNHFGYEITVVQAFTAGSNNFVSSSGPRTRVTPCLTLRPADFLCIGTGNRGSHRRIWRRLGPGAYVFFCVLVSCADGQGKALAATIGPLVEVPVLLALTWVSLYLHQKLNWTPSASGAAVHIISDSEKEKDEGGEASV